jgi:hypothetical protein
MNEIICEAFAWPNFVEFCRDFESLLEDQKPCLDLVKFNKHSHFEVHVIECFS